MPSRRMSKRESAGRTGRRSTANCSPEPTRGWARTPLSSPSCATPASRSGSTTSSAGRSAISASASSPTPTRRPSARPGWRRKKAAVCSAGKKCQGAAMSKGPQKIRGTQDIWGEAAERFQAVVAGFERVRRLYGFRRVEMPVFEATEVFSRSIGETTDIVSKEMYSFEDRGGDSLTLRPEFTAGICRAYLSEGWQQLAPVKIATHGPAFRYERPQKGRYRQFHQLDAEIIGAGEPAADVELIAMGAQLLDELGISGRVELKLNTLGDPATRDAWRAALVEHFQGRRGDLSDESRARLDKNPLRILDSKEHQDFPIVDAAPVVDDFLTAEASDFFGHVTAGLDA